MKLLLLTALTLSILSAQKPEKPKQEPPKEEPSFPAERNLAKDEALQFKLDVANILLLRKTYDVDKYEAELKPLSDDQNAIIVAACKSVGVDPAGIQKGECGFNAGIGPDGKPLLGADGKPVQPRVWKNPPPPSQPADKK